MKSNITNRLMLYFTSVLLLFALVVGTLFSFLFSKNSTYLYKQDLLKRAESIANNLSFYMSSNESSKGPFQLRNHIGYGVYLKIIDDIAMSDVWIIDKSTKTVYVSSSKKQITYQEILPNSSKILDDVFNGHSVISGGNYSLFNPSPEVSIGVPIYDNNKNIIAAVILHTYLSETYSPIKGGIKILLGSIFIALILGLIMAILISRKFTLPLRKMQKTTRILAEGNYNVKTDVVQNDEIGELANDIDILSCKLKKAKKESDSLEEMRKNYISNISHELRTPVTVIRGSLEAICDDIITDSTTINQYHKEMLSESIHLERMVNDLLELSRLQTPDYIIEKSDIDLISVVSDAVRSIRHIASEKNIQIKYDVPSISCHINGDYGRLRQMFIIILDNAVKFSFDNGLITIDINQINNKTSISIIDNGSGISKERLPHIFDRFYKTIDENNTKGTGLGLSIAKEIANRHDINIMVRSTPNKETRFTFTYENL